MDTASLIGLLGFIAACFLAAVARPHSSFAGRTPDEVYAIDSQPEKLAA